MKDNNVHSTHPDIISAFASTVANATDPIDAFRAAELATSTLIGHALFTVMAFDPERIEVQRLYTSDPESYPTGGRKKKRDTEWGRHVLLDGKVYIGSNEQDIRNSFDDHEVIISLGLCSVINIPIKRMGTTIGTMNLLDTTAHYDEADAHIGSVIAMGIATTLS